MGDGIPVDPPLRNGSAQVHGSCVNEWDCEGENDWKMGERERVDVLSVMLQRMRHDAGMTSYF